MRYRGFGLELDSDFALSGAVEIPDRSGSADLAIVRGSARLGSAAYEHEPYRFLDGKLELTVPRIGQFVLDRPDRLMVDPAAQAEQVDVSALLIASGIPMALWAKDGWLLHGSGVIRPGYDGALVIAGASGSGKSTLARVLVERGAALLGDDSLWLRDRSGAIATSGLPSGIFGADIAGLPRQFWPVPRGQQADHAAVEAIVVLEPDSPAAPLKRLSGADALAALLRHRHRPRIPAILGLEAERLGFAALLCAAVPVYALGGAPDCCGQRLEQLCGLPPARR